MRAIDLDGIYTAYEGDDRPIIRDLTLHADSGEYLVIGGPNSAGKTTLLEAMIGLVRIIHGTASVCGIDVLRSPLEVRKRAGYVLQNFYFDPFTPFTAEEVVMMGRYGRLGMLRRPSEEDREAVRRAMELVGIEDLAEKTIGTLSGGQQQKVLIAHNLAKEPELILLDEPFSNLDLGARRRLQGILQRLSDEGTTVVVVSHAFDQLPEATIHLVGMSEGRIVQDVECHAEEVREMIRRMVG